MEDENGLELSLGLSLGNSSSKAKSSDLTPNPNPSPNPNPKLDEGSSSKNCASEFSFANLFPKNGKHNRELQSEDLLNTQKRNKIEQKNSVIIDLTKSSHLSINTGEGSVGENDDVVESDEADTNNCKSKSNNSAGSEKKMLAFNASGSVPNHSVIQLMGTPAGDRAVAFGYSPVQLPTFEASPTWVIMGSKDRAEDEERKSQDLASKPSKEKELAVIETVKEAGPAIRPGVAPGMKFGGSGSHPDLPWVSTTGSGPHGKTISGVTYKYGKDQLRIVCACHGTHMSTEEFVLHASSADVANIENNNNNNSNGNSNSHNNGNGNIVSFAVGNPATSAQN